MQIEWSAQPGRGSAGEGQRHKARVYVFEESHNGILHMKHSNKDGPSLAESGEGRPLIKENVRQPKNATVRHQEFPAMH